ncbi:MAG: ABC transporter substrate-binding protein [Novosphingobium sp. 28-62-57]|uniref:ABC transporter substrate-binding protein n=1 Tax=unclassified Novosphingobium TaxID=2644732 RepID=UPI000BDC9E24|nr:MULTISPECIES: ABC transporter substrate-binding protein [unclassified Novosphingobium]OYW48173.1 MAG: ABC transporter substrate-binding protein [Novosphingobium sp. 12-63-9]OYZ08927.1 MAG: ABC transporter substrate-binding protein [Novosphingobium sp. 28-62-57]OZA39638.1 MAG: ABC transporter substrate-binding protein [Novosphingobium sp. 17-62-9]HQS68269.1 ABC transporter substrate-binding protein [Novosphingobium sp.]
MLSRRGLLGGLAAGAVLAPADQLIGKPRVGGRIRVAGIVASTADTIDPAKGGNSSDYMRLFLLYSGLTQYDGALRAQPGLAEAIETDDNIVWTIRLRRGVQFHNGKTLSADDVVYSLLRHKDPAVGSKVKAVAEQFASARRVGPLEVELRLTGPNPDIPIILAQAQFVIVENGRRDFSVANGTGPFVLKSFAPGIRTVVRRNPNYWKPGKPYLDEIELIAIPDELSRVNALLSGDVQMVISVSPGSVKRVKASSSHLIMETKSGLYTDLVMRQDHPLTGNPDFVLGMKHLLDRDLIKRALFRGYATIANDQPISPLDPYYNPGIPQRAFDPEKAKFYLKRSGLLGTRLPVYVSPAATQSVDMGSILQEHAAQIGLKLAVNRVPSDGYWSTHWMRHPLTFGNINQRPTTDLMFSLFFQSKATENEAAWKNSKFDRMLIEARQTRDESVRKAIYGEMQWMIHRTGGIGIPVFISLLDGYDRRVRGLQPVPLGGLMGYTFGEHVWLDA